MRLSRKALAGLGIAVACSAGVVAIAATGTPYLNRAAATFVLNPVPFPNGEIYKHATCLAENGDSMVSQKGTAAGQQTDLSPIAGHGSLSGWLVVSGIETVDGTPTLGGGQNPNFGLGWFSGSSTLYTDSSMTTIIYRGHIDQPIQLIDAQADAVVRSMVKHQFLNPDGSPTGYYLLANEEVSFNASNGQLTGELGGSDQGTPDLALETNFLACPGPYK